MKERLDRWMMAIHVCLYTVPIVIPRPADVTSEAHSRTSGNKPARSEVLSIRTWSSSEPRSHYAFGNGLLTSPPWPRRPFSIACQEGIFMKSSLRVGLAGITLLGWVCVFVHPFGAVNAAHSDAPIFAGTETPSPVIEVIERSCQNCHSERTVWPWYSYMPPISWMIENDVYQARKHMNISRWQDYTTEEQV